METEAAERRREWRRRRGSSRARLQNCALERSRVIPARMDEKSICGFSKDGSHSISKKDERLCGPPIEMLGFNVTEFRIAREASLRRTRGDCDLIKKHIRGKPHSLNSSSQPRATSNSRLRNGQACFTRPFEIYDTQEAIELKR